MTVPAAWAEQARARMLALFPEGFEETEANGQLELAAYTEAGGADRLRQAFGEVSVSEIAEGWERRWRAFHRPVQVGPVWVGPPWEEPPAGPIAVVIDPGGAFGTGAHATTRLSLAALSTFERTGLLDVGCGSGVLAIAAAKLGFDPVFALDRDDDAVQATLENAAANRVELAVRRADAVMDELPAAPTAVANIALAEVERVAARVHSRRLLVSGYLASERPVLAGWLHCERRELDGWAADVFTRAAPA